MHSKNGPGWNWLLIMALRDSRRNRSRLFLFISSIILGIAALVAIYSLGDNMRQEIDEQAASLICADLEITSNKEVSPSMRSLLDSLGDHRSEERSFVSMVLFPKTNDTRLVQVRALQGSFPYYGLLETEPLAAGKSFRHGQQALVDQTLMLQFNAKVGDSIKVGNVSFIIAGTLLNAPGQTGLGASVSPPVYIPLQYLDQTGLSQKGSRIGYKFYYKYKNPEEVNTTIGKIESRLEEESLDYETIASQKEETNRSFRDVTRFLSLIGFIALLLGCIGVASAIHIYVREKIRSIAILRCLGATSLQAFMIFLIQIISVGFIGSLIGAVLGTFVQQLLPLVLKEFFPFNISTSVSYKAIFQGIFLGVIISILFSLLPLVSIRHISPLNTIRASVQVVKQRIDPVRLIVYTLILLFITTFTYLQLKDLLQSLIFTLGVVLAFLILLGIAHLLMWSVRKFFPTSWNYLWRQGLSNLFRPNNQTAILIVSIGLGTAFICTLFFIQTILLNRITMSASDFQPNMVLFDIQSSQKQQVSDLVRQQGLPVHGTVPIVNMRLESVNSITPAKLKADSSLKMQNWIFSREYRVTFRDTLTSSEKLVGGKWSVKANASSESIYVSVEQNYAKRNGIELGDTMTFNVQGAKMSTIVSSLREVDWNKIQTNFLIVFPSGVLEDAPQFHVLMTRVNSKETSAQFQQAVVRQFPNVSIIDLGLILSVIDDVLQKVSFVIRFMAGFSIFTGLIVLIASVLISKYQRIEESVLLRTLGGSRRQIFMITALEYFFLGAFAALTGILLAIAGSWALAHYTFETSFTPDIIAIIFVFLSVCSLTVGIGLINSRSVLSKPPLEILRKEI
jgi:putative ABC transport system permease protein